MLIESVSTDVHATTAGYTMLYVHIVYADVRKAQPSAVLRTNWKVHATVCTALYKHDT
jgi:hypothetical protein